MGTRLDTLELGRLEVSEGFGHQLKRNLELAPHGIRGIGKCSVVWRFPVRQGDVRRQTYLLMMMRFIYFHGFFFCGWCAVNQVFPGWELLSQSACHSMVYVSYIVESARLASRTPESSTTSIERLHSLEGRAIMSALLKDTAICSSRFCEHADPSLWIA